MENNFIKIIIIVLEMVVIGSSFLIEIARFHTIRNVVSKYTIDRSQFKN